MESLRLVGRRGLVAAALACVAAISLACASVAFAVQSDQYDPFLNPVSCPTDSPYFNNPEFPEVACVSSASAKTSLAIGKFSTETTSPIVLSFGFAPGSVEPEVCPEVECFRSVPGSTVLEHQPLTINLPRVGHGEPKQGKGHRGKRTRPFSVRATLEPAGDVHAFSFFGAEPGKPIPLLRLPMKIHLQGRFLGSNCYIGSDASPIDLALYPIAEPSVEFLEDPNGFPVFQIVVKGLTTANNSFAVPAAKGCGPTVGFGKHKFNLFDERIDKALGLPAPAGKNVLVLGDSVTNLVVSLAGGAALKAAMAAAQ